MLAAEASDEHRPALEVALVGEVVNREHAGRAVQRLRPLDGIQVDGHQRGLPVVGVDDVGNEPERLAQLERAARQEREALEVVGIGLPGRAVEDTGDRRSGCTRGSRSARRCPAVAPGAPAARALPKYIGTVSVPSRRSSALQRMPWYSGITTRTSMPRRRKRLGQRPGDVGEPAGLAERARPRTRRTGSFSGMRRAARVIPPARPRNPAHWRRTRQRTRAASAWRKAVVDVREDVVWASTGRQVILVHRARLQSS